MTRRYIGIDIGRSHLRAVQIARTPDGPLIEKVFGMQTRRSTDSLPDILRSLVDRHGFERTAETIVSVPAQAVFFTEIQADATAVQALRTGTASQVMGGLPIPAEEIVAQVCSTRTIPPDKCGILIAATSSESLRELLHALAQARLRPTAIDAPVSAIRMAVAFNHPEMAEGTAVILSVDVAALSLTVTENGKVLICRNIPVPCDQDAECPVEQIAAIAESELEITWRRLFGGDPDKDLRVFIVSAPGRAAELAAALAGKFECRTTAVDPYANVRRTGDAAADFPICMAEGLALRTLSGDQGHAMDFLAAYHARVRPGWAVKRELALCAALVALTAMAWVAGLFVQRSCLESEYEGLKKQIRDAFQQALPQEKNIVNPPVQLRQQLEAMRKDPQLAAVMGSGRLSPLEMMHALTTHAPADGNVALGDTFITADSVQAMGSCDSFGVLAQWQQRLEQIGQFGTVAFENQMKDAKTGRVHFTLLMSSARTGP